MTEIASNPDCSVAAELAASPGDLRFPGVRSQWQVLRGALRPSVVTTVAVAFCTFGLLIVQGILLARMLGPTVRGEYGAAVLYAQTLTYIGLLGAHYAIGKRALAETGQRLELSRSAIRLGSLTGLATWAAVAILALAALPSEKSKLIPLCIVSGMMLPFEHMRVGLLAVDRGSGKFGRYNVNQLVTTAVLPAILVVLWLAHVTSLWLLVCMTLVGPIVGLTLRLAACDWKALLAGPAAPSVSTLAKEGRPYFLSVLISDVFGRLDALLFLWLASFTAQGYYAVAVAASNLLLVAPNALALFTFNVGAGDTMAGGVKGTVYMTVALVALQAVTAVCLALVLQPLVRAVFGNAFLGAIPLMLALLPAYALCGVTHVAEGYLRGRGKIRAGVLARTFGAAAMVAVALGLYGSLAELAIPIGACVAHLLVTVILGWFVLQDVRERQTERNPSAAMGGAG